MGDSNDDLLHNTKRKLEEECETSEGGIVKKPKAGEITLDPPGLLDLSDDVLLCLLRHCQPHHIRALSFCCRRFSLLCRDRSLWRRLDLRARRLGARALANYVRAMPPRTTLALCIRGLVGRSDNIQSDSSYVVSSDGASYCDITVNHHIVFANATAPNNQACPQRSASEGDLPAGRFGYPIDKDAKNAANESIKRASENPGPVAGPSRSPGDFTSKESGGNSSPRPFSPSPPAPPEGRTPDPDGDMTVTKETMLTIRRKCPALKELRLEYCYIDCAVIHPSVFPPTLEKLSLRGCVCRNVPFSRSYLFRIQDFCPLLQELDLSRCGWLASHSLLVLSKMPHLRRLSLRSCWGLGECVAYASLSARYGFKSLEVLDIRGTPMGDSEVSAFSMISSLRELYLQAQRGVAAESENPPSVNISDDEVPLENPSDCGQPHAWEAEDPFGDYEEEEEEEEEEVEQPPVETPEARPQSPPRPLPGDEAAPEAVPPPNGEAPIPEEGDPFAAANRVHVIYVDVRRARNNAMRVVYAHGAPQNARVEGDQPERNENDPPHPDIILGEYPDLPPPINLMPEEDIQIQNEDGPNIPLNVHLHFPAPVMQDPVDPPVVGREEVVFAENRNNRPRLNGEFLRIGPDFLMMPNMEMPADEAPNIVMQVRDPHAGQNINIEVQIGNDQPEERRENPLDVGEPHVYRRGLFNVQVFQAPPQEQNELPNWRRVVQWPMLRREREDTSRLITDGSILHFGVSHNIVHLSGQTNTRVSHLRVLVCRGFPRVTNRALTHLATAMPSLVRLDMTDTGVTTDAVRNFRILRPDCVLTCGHIDK